MDELASSANLADRQHSRRSVAVIGSGPGGLVAAKYLKHHGFEPVVFEQDSEIGGQWNVRSAHSGIWPSMVTNTSRLLTCFSDLALKPGTPIFPSNKYCMSPGATVPNCSLTGYFTGDIDLFTASPTHLLSSNLVDLHLLSATAGAHSQWDQEIRPK